MALETLSLELELDGVTVGGRAIHGFKIEEDLMGPYRIAIDLNMNEVDVDPVALLGGDVVFTIHRMPISRRMCGVARTVEGGEQRADGGTNLHVEVVPAFALAALRRNTRMFQKKSVPEILEIVLADALGTYGRSASLELNASYPTREYCLQYQESDLDFVSRLMQEEGIYPVFDHEGGVEQLLLRDDNSPAALVETVVPGEIRFDTSDVRVAEYEPIFDFSVSEAETMTSVHVRDANWTLATHPVEATASGTDELGRTRESYEHGEGRALTISDYDQGVRRYQASDAARRVTLRQETLAAPGRVGLGGARTIGLRPGSRFRLAGHPTVGLDDDYLVTRVVHTSEEPEGLRGIGATEAYHARFECIPFATPYRAPRTVAAPRIPSIQTAVVTGPGGQEIHTDEWGRVKVQFAWDRENPANETSSVWLRVRQAWAGAGWGALWTPRIGTEVVVSFVDGDPDRPLVTGSLYDGPNLVPYSLPDERTKSTMKSNSSLGGGGFNEIRFEDKAGSEEVFVHSQKDMNRVTLNNERIDVGVNQTVSVAINQDQTIGSNQTESIGVDQSLTVGSNRVVDVGSNFTETIGATSTITVSGHATETLDAGETQTVNAGRTETVNAGETRTVNGGQTETVNGFLTQTVNGGITQTINGAVTETFGSTHTITTTATYTHQVVGSMLTMTPSSVHLTALGGYALVCPPGGLVIAPGGWNINAPAQKFWLESFTLTLAENLFQIVGVKIKIVGAKASAIKTKRAYTGVAVAVTGASVSVTGLKVKYKLKIKAKAGAARIEGLLVHVSGLHLFI